MQTLQPVVPDSLRQVDVSRVCFCLDFLSSCQLQPADFLNFRRLLRTAGDLRDDGGNNREGVEWENLLQPTVSPDPKARRKFQKPAPAYVLTIPIVSSKNLEAGDRLNLEVLFLGTGVPLIHVFLRHLIQVGQLGLVNGEGRFEVSEVFSRGTGADDIASLAWHQNQPLASISCSVLPLDWLLTDDRIPAQLTLRYLTPVRLLVDGKPLRKPRFGQVFRFMLRRVTSMLHAHAGIDQLDNPHALFAKADALANVASSLRWQDWRAISDQKEQSIGGFLGEMTVAGSELDDLYWVLATASLLGIGKYAAYGAGHFSVDWQACCRRSNACYN